MKKFDLSKEKFNDVPEHLQKIIKNAGKRYTDRIAKQYDDTIDAIAHVYGLDREVVEQLFSEGM